MRNSLDEGANYFQNQKLGAGGQKSEASSQKSGYDLHELPRIQSVRISRVGLAVGDNRRFRCRLATDDWLVAFHRLSRKNCAPADIGLVTTKEAPETAGLAQFVQFVEPRSVELCNVQPV